MRSRRSTRALPGYPTAWKVSSPQFLIATASLWMILGIWGATSPQALAPTGVMQLINSDGERLTRVLGDDIRAILRGAVVRAFGDAAASDRFGCAGEWSHTDARTAEYGRYSIQDSQYCIAARIGPDYRYCAWLFRGESGKLFGELGPVRGLRGIIPLEITTPAGECR
jgi:hypothetical protein